MGYPGYGGWTERPQKDTRTPAQKRRDAPDHPCNVPERYVPTIVEDMLLSAYRTLRLDAHDLEELIGSNPDGLTEQDLKRLDKALVLMKAGFKVVKKVLRAHGYTERVTPRFELSSGRDEG